jgi:GTPase SAR1 family protein
MLKNFFEISNKKYQIIIDSLTVSLEMECHILLLGPYRLCLKTNDMNLVDLACKNFEEIDSEGYDIEIYSIVDDPCLPNVVDLKANSRYYSNEHNSVIQYNCKSYSYFKMSYKTLCSEFSAQRQVLPMHCASFIIGDLGIVILGASGSGKTTLMSKFIKKYQKEIYMVCEDWGYFKNGNLISGGEISSYLKVDSLSHYLDKEVYEKHLKAPEEIVGENRIMISTNDFSFNTVTTAEISRLAVIILTPASSGINIAKVSPSESLKLLKKPFYNKVLEKYVSFFNGSIPATSTADYSGLFLELFTSANVIIHFENNYLDFAVDEFCNLVFKDDKKG